MGEAIAKFSRVRSGTPQIVTSLFYNEAQARAVIARPRSGKKALDSVLMGKA